jgi:ribosome-associated protein
VEPGTSARVSGAHVPSSRSVAIAAARAAADKQAGEIVILDVRELIVITDYFVIATAGTKRQIKTVIEAIEDAVRAMGEKPIRREGEPEAGWWLLDYVDVVVHVFGLEERDYYDLERLWRDAPRVAWEPAGAASSSR